MAGLATFAILTANGLAADATPSATPPSVNGHSHHTNAHSHRKARKSKKLGDIDGPYKITMTIENYSNQTWDITQQSLGHDSTGSGWDARPTTLAPGHTETVSAYSVANGQAIDLTLTAEESHRNVRLVAQDPWHGANNTFGTQSSDPFKVFPLIGSGMSCSAIFIIFGSI